MYLVAFDSLAPERFQWDLNLNEIVKLTLVIVLWNCDWTSLLISWFRKWLGATRQQTVHYLSHCCLCHYMASLSHKELILHSAASDGSQQWTQRSQDDDLFVSEFFTHHVTQRQDRNSFERNEFNPMTIYFWRKILISAYIVWLQISELLS